MACMKKELKGEEIVSSIRYVARVEYLRPIL